jgi:hypothetical protein
MYEGKPKKKPERGAKPLGHQSDEVEVMLFLENLIRCR